MAWDTIAASEVDANSPLNQTLFDKIRQNLGYLAVSCICFSGDDPTEKLINGDDSWVDVKTGLCYVPSFADALDLRVECMFSDSNVSGRSLRVRIDDGVGGYNTSETTGVGNGSYEFKDVDCPASGSFSGSGAWREFKVQIKHAEGAGTWKTAWVRNVVFRVKSII